MMIRTPGINRLYRNCGACGTVSPHDRKRCIPQACFCEKGEVLKNGGFETPSPNPFEVFAYWTIQARSPNINLFRDTENVYQGKAAASIQTSGFSKVHSTLILRQYVDVTPGCLYRLKFAERMVALGEWWSFAPLMVARVIYLDRNLNEYELLNITIEKKEADEEYNLHEQTADLPVPCDVPGIIVQFSFYQETALLITEPFVWNLDAVSLQSVSEISACC